MTYPPTPQDVRVTTLDGTEVAVSCQYVGTDAEGIHIWHVVDGPPISEVREVRVGVLPARCGVEFPA